MAPGYEHTCALRNIGEGFCWGNVTNDMMLTQPTPITMPEPIVHLAAGRNPT